MRRALVECWRTAGTTSSFRYLINSVASFSTRSAVSFTALFTRELAWLKSVIFFRTSYRRILDRLHYFAVSAGGSIANVAHGVRSTTYDVKSNTIRSQCYYPALKIASGSAAHFCVGMTRTAVTFPGGARGIRFESGFQRSCCNRRESQW